MIEGLRILPSISAQEFGAFIQRGASCGVHREAPKISSEPLTEIGESTVYVRGGLGSLDNLHPCFDDNCALIKRRGKVINA